MAAAYKCLSCGHNSLKRRAFGRGPEHNHLSNVGDDFDDEYSLVSSTSTISAPPLSKSYQVTQSQIRGRGGNDELVKHLVDLRGRQQLSSSAGELLSLSPVHPPPASRMQPQRLKTADSANIPLYRRSQKVNYMKEIVKIPAQVPTLPQMTQTHTMSVAR